MNLKLTHPDLSKYKSNSQRIRVLTEHWVDSNMYCPNCENTELNDFSNNKPVADFFCSNCCEEYELKSKQGKLGKKVIDGAFQSMIKRITSANNPNFFFLSYNNSSMEVENFILIPKHFFIPNIIEQRKPLAENARRAGWVGCNIVLTGIPKLGKISIIQNSKIINRSEVTNKWNKSFFLRNSIIESKGWLIDVLNCIDKIEQTNFTLKDVYKFENDLKKKYPNNSFIKDKIRQQLQLLRDQGIIAFTSRGNYKKMTS
ncbi:MAG: hypothetical protein K8R74_11255 [Bacteroidales bacterium]|nr:hypothetical protein [Bacteroidales bacterium]